jgi:hypothetical protein
MESPCVKPEQAGAESGSLRDFEAVNEEKYNESWLNRQCRAENHLLTGNLAPNCAWLLIKS